MLSYLKTQGYSDAMLSIMRGVNVITGLGGTVLAPWLEQHLGSVRSGSWSIWFVLAHLMLTTESDIAYAPHRSEVVCLVPVIVALQSSWNKTELGAAVLLFGGSCSLMVLSTLMLMYYLGMAFSRIGLWSFDLIQTKQLQVSLEEHPERNTL